MFEMYDLVKVGGLKEVIEILCILKQALVDSEVCLELLVGFRTTLILNFLTDLTVQTSRIF